MFILVILLLMVSVKMMHDLVKVIRKTEIKTRVHRGPDVNSCVLEVMGSNIGKMKYMFPLGNMSKVH